MKSTPFVVRINETDREIALRRSDILWRTRLKLQRPLAIAKSRLAFAKSFNSTQNDVVFVSGQSVRVNLAGLQVKDVLFHAAVTAAVGTIVKMTSEDPPRYLVKLLFSFRGISEVEVPAERVSPN